MILRHFMYLPSYADHHTIVDDFGNELTDVFVKVFPVCTATTLAWHSAYRFTKGQTFEESGMRSAQAPIDEH